MVLSIEQDMEGSHHLEEEIVASPWSDEPDAAHDLLYQGRGRDRDEKRRLVVRGPRVAAMRIVALDAAAEPPTMTVEVDLRGRRYVQDRDTAAIISGDDSREHSFTERWVMSLSGDDKHPWRITDARGRVASG